MSDRRLIVPPPRTGDRALDDFTRRTARALRPAPTVVVRQDAAQHVVGGWTTIGVAGAAGTKTLDVHEYVGAVIEFTGALTGNRVVVLPTNGWLKGFVNSTSGAFTLTVQTERGAGVAVTQGRSRMLACDGTDVRAIGAEL